MSALRDWARLDARWYADPLVRAAAAVAPEVMVLWPVLVGMAKHESHADDNPHGVILIHLDDLAHACRRDANDTHSALKALEEVGLIWSTTEAANALRISLSGFAKWQTARKSDAERRANKRWRDDDASRENVSLSHGRVTVASRPSHGLVMPDVDVDIDVDKKEPLSSKDDDVANVFEYWCKVERETGGLGASPNGRRPKLTKDRAAKIRARLSEGYSPADLKMAIAFYARDPHHSGDNDRSTRFTDLKTTLKNGSKVEAGVAGYEARGAGVAVTSNGVNVNEFVRSLGGAA